MKNLIILISFFLLFSCKKEESTISYDNSRLANTYWQAQGGYLSLRFTATECTEHVSGMSPITKRYFIIGDKLHFYSLDNSAYTKIYIIGNSLYWNYTNASKYDYLYTRK